MKFIITLALATAAIAAPLANNKRTDWPTAPVPAGEEGFTANAEKRSIWGPVPVSIVTLPPSILYLLLQAGAEGQTAEKRTDWPTAPVPAGEEGFAAIAEKRSIWGPVPVRKVS